MRKTDFTLSTMILFLGLGVVFSFMFLLSFPLVSTGFILASILCFFLVIVIHGCRTFGYRDFTVFFAIAYSIPFLYEYTDAVGFGALVGVFSSYSDILGPKFLDKTPYIIPLTWAMFMYCALMMTVILFTQLREARGSWRLVRTVEKGIVLGVIMASLDLVLDPVMVAMGAWSWSYHGSYFGIPLWNYEGWIEIPFFTFLFFSLYLVAAKRQTTLRSLEDPPQYSLVLVGIYVLSLILYSIYTFSWHAASVVPWGLLIAGSISTVTVLQFHRYRNNA
jgi:uncharacterized membrane protein